MPRKTMGIQVKKGMYKDIESVIVVTDKLKATFLPSQGGKLTSLVFRETGRDYLAQRKEEKYRKLGLETSYTQAECAAYDDMFPTIDPWAYPDGPLKGLEYLDHGEVARVPHAFTERDGAVCTYMKSGILPYTFEKRITDNARGGLRIEFTATNTGEHDFDFIWAAHFMAVAEEGGYVLSPYPDGAKAEIAFSTNAEKYGERGDVCTLPYGVDGKTRLDMSKAYGAGAGDAWKFYYSDAVPEGWLGYQYPSDGTRLMFTFPKDKVPYAGLWMNDGSGGLGMFHNAALEVCTGSFDRPDTARERGQYSVLKTGEPYTWYLEIDITKG